MNTLNGLKFFVALAAFVAVGFAGCSTPVTSTPCTADEECSNGQICQEGTCADPPPCTMDSECGSGEVCEAGTCVEIPPPTMEMGFTEDDESYRLISDGDVMPFFAGNQGGSHIFPTFRVGGFPNVEDGRLNLEIDENVTLVADGSLLSSFRQITQFEEIEDGVLELQRRFVFLSGSPTGLNGQQVNVRFSLTSVDDDAFSAEVMLTVELELRDQ
jgi:Cys-rich repeat protein